MTRKIVALTDAVGKLIRFVVPPRQSHDLMAMPDLLQSLSCERMIGDKALDSDALLADLVERGAEAVIPPRTNRHVQRNFDQDLYRERHRMENVFTKIKEFRAVAIWHRKTVSSFMASIHLVAGVNRRTIDVNRP